MTELPRLLMVSPVMPALSGNGLAMRAAMSLRALAHHYRVSLLVVPYYPSPAGQNLAPALSELCEAVQLKSGDFESRITKSSVAGPLAGPFDVVHVFRLASLPTARYWFKAADAVHLDLDDIESVSRPRVAALYHAHGRAAEATREEQASRKALTAEIDALMHFNRVYVCSAEDRDRLPFCGSAEVRTLPNAVEVPPCQAPPAERPDEPFTFLFVGTIGYFPNEEGLVYFATKVLPVLRDLAPRQFRIQIVGSGVSAAIQHLSEIPEIDVIGEVSDVGPWYARANAVIAPIRAGGGTRIKVLEAFSFRRPIVSTTIGVEGIAVKSGVHALIADQPEQFAAACRRLMVDPTLSHQLGDSAFQLVRDSYSLDSMVKAVAPDFRRPLPH